ncbi:MULTISPECIES: PAS domain-containing protein [Ramlibacter]|uniref:histidine kinase n=1 Tax=Ramlibacter pinisoli TaxID=2682844 RepID=A0A6N8J0U6_9BURK|nr:MULTISPECIES: PAS domain-containing protein [Ramlibacter]MBA2962716.1 PAS domain-containing protein [Ramlibacter sp. CGMCC 1.13660]MVQ32658.1 PAS domain-containing protein [Ramlibacter pinisoli]
MTSQQQGSSLFDDPSALLHAIADATDDVIFAKDLQGCYQFANPAMLAAMGRPAEEVIGRTDLEIQPDENLARRLMANDRAVIASGGVLEREEAIRTPGGEERFWLARKMPLRDPDGRIVGVLGISRDVTRRKQADAEREADRLKLRMGIQAAGLVMAEIDYRHDRNHISAELARLIELGDQDMVVPRQAIFDRVHPDDRQRYVEAIAATTDPAGSGLLAIDVRALLPSGIVRWLHIRLQVTFSEVDGQLRPDRGFCAARDVTAERQAESRLRAAQRMTESVIEGAGALVYAKDLAGRYILFNHAWRTQTALTPEQALGATDDQLFGPEAARQLRANDRQVAESGEPLQVQERVVMNGRTIVYRSSKFPLYDDSGRIHAVCGVSTDVTDVVEADRRKDEFLATLAHELRNPLAPIRNGLEILRLSQLAPKAERTREIMERQFRHLVRLVDDLLDVSRISRGKLELRLQPTTLQQCIAEALEASQGAVEAAGHSLAVDLAPQPLRLHGDPTRLAQVVGNLVNNATRYTPPGGHLRVSARAEGGQAVLQVSDDGSGIAAETLPRVFDLFAQGTAAPHQAQAGLGIGLWLVRKLVDRHHGTIEACSDGPGRGSTFTVRLPLADG